MGAVAGRLSDVIVITSDNPRERGSGAHHRRDPARHHARHASRSRAAHCWRSSIGSEAIDEAIELARPGDLVLIAGKGHEKYQVIGSQTLPFDDVAVAHGSAGAPAQQVRV